MPERTLRLLFDPAVLPESPSRGRTVICFQKTTDSAIRGESLKEFCGAEYADLGREVGLDWLRRFSTPGREGKTLHDLFQWEGTSALWFTRQLFLYEDLGVFPVLLALVRSMRLAEVGEIDAVELFGAPPGVAQAFAKAGIPWTVGGGGPSQRRGRHPLSKLRDNGRGVFRRFFLSRRLKKKFAANHRPGQTDALLYLAVQGEWLSGPGGGHRYLEETLSELLDLGEAASVRPIVYGIPPAFAEDGDWREFLGRSLREKGGVYPIGYVTLADDARIRLWVKRSMAALSRWLAEAPADFDRAAGVDVGPAIRGALADLAGQLERGLLQFLAFKKTFASIRPKGLLLKDEVYPHGRIAIAAAKAEGVRTVSLQHGSIYPTHWCYLMDPGAQERARPPLPDVFGVYGPAVAKLLSESNGFPSDLLRILGARRFRELDRMTPSTEFTALAEEGRPVVLVAGQLHQDMSVVYDWTFTLAERNPHLIFIFKPHPRDQAGVAAIESRCESLENSRIFLGPIGDILPAVDLAISGHSTVLLESIWLGIGGVSVLVSGESAEDWREKGGLLKIARTPDQLQGFLSALTEGSLFSGPDRVQAESYLEDHLGRSVARDREALRGLFS